MKQSLFREIVKNGRRIEWIRAYSHAAGMRRRSQDTVMLKKFFFRILKNGFTDS